MMKEEKKARIRDIIRRDEWDKFYYNSRQFNGQKKLKDESEEAEIEKVEIVLNELKSLGYINSTNYNLDKFSRFRNLVHENFFIYWTAINPPMERLLYALSYILQPKNILGIGIFTGNPLIWSLGPAINGVYSAEKLTGIEINKDHAKICQNNMDKITEHYEDRLKEQGSHQRSDQGSDHGSDHGSHQTKNRLKINIFGEDGFEILKKYDDNELDLLYLDANGKDPLSKSVIMKNKNTKRINYSLLKAAYSKIKSGSFVICHNAYQPSFKREANDYLKWTEDSDYFSKTCTIGIDEMGIEFSIKK